MTKLIGSLAIFAAIVLAPALARAQDDEWETVPAPQTPQELPPEGTPPPPPAEQPAAPQEEAQPWVEEVPPQAQPEPQRQSSSPVPPGQWVHTQQYGWIWMPYSDAYTQVPASGYGAPYSYVYYPAWSSWTWIAAPWVWGIGPWPWFGHYGPAGYAWYGHGWWRYPSHWHYSSPYGGYSSPYRGYAYRGSRPAPVPYRGALHGGAPYRGSTYRGAPYRGTVPSYRSGLAAPRAGGPAVLGRGGAGGFVRPAPAMRSGGFGRGGGVPHGSAPRGGSGGRGGAHVGHGRGR